MDSRLLSTILCTLIFILYGSPAISAQPVIVAEEVKLNALSLKNEEVKTKLVRYCQNRIARELAKSDRVEYRELKPKKTKTKLKPAKLYLRATILMSSKLGNLPDVGKKKSKRKGKKSMNINVNMRLVEMSNSQIKGIAMSQAKLKWAGWPEAKDIEKSELATLLDKTLVSACNQIIANIK